MQEKYRLCNVKTL